MHRPCATWSTVGHWAAARVGLELLDALDAAHRAGIVHHDVKPANVMVAPSGRVKLADFGLASLQDDTQRTLTGATGAMGRGDGRAVTAAFRSLPYVAPEQASGGPAGPAADLWALGATLWFAVEGVAPFERAGPAATLGAILHDPPGRPTRAGPLEPVLLALLAKDPDHRPPATLVRRMLEPLAAVSSPSAAASHPSVPLAAGTSTAPSAGTTPCGQPGPRPRRDPVSSPRVRVGGVLGCPREPGGVGANRLLAGPRRRAGGGGVGGGGCWRLAGSCCWWRWLAVSGTTGAAAGGRLGWVSRFGMGSLSSWSARWTAGLGWWVRESGASPPLGSSVWSGCGSRTPAGRVAPSEVASSICSMTSASVTTPTWMRPSGMVTGSCSRPTSIRVSGWRGH